MNFEKSDLRLLKKYFSRRLKTVFGAAFLIVGIAALIVWIFVRNGGPIGLPVGALCVIAAIILFLGGVSDGAFDETLEKYALVPDKVTCAFDLKVKPAHAGKDGKIRSARFVVVTILNFCVKCLQIRFSLLRQTEYQLSALLYLNMSDHFPLHKALSNDERSPKPLE